MLHTLVSQMNVRQGSCCHQPLLTAVAAAEFASHIWHAPSCRYDILAMPKYGGKLAGRLESPLIVLEGGHFLNRERGVEVNLMLHHIIWRAGPAGIPGAESRYLQRSRDWPGPRHNTISGLKAAAEGPESSDHLLQPMPN